MSEAIIRAETANDIGDIRAINVAAFRDQPYSEQTEHLIVDALRADGALALSLVAVLDGRTVGHIAFSAATVGAARHGWYLVGPVAVLPAHWRRGLGSALVRAGLAALRSHGADGCVLVGDPRFYERFGFRTCAGLAYPGVPDEVVLGLPFHDSPPVGRIVAHAAFGVRPQTAADADP